MEGYYLWLQPSPDDTDIDCWVYSKYQNLDKRPLLNPGEQIKHGQVIPYSSKTGTTDGHYGKSGYPHLHISTMKAASDKHKIIGSQMMTKNSTLFDPLQMFMGIQAQDQMAKQTYQLKLPYAVPDERITPSESRVVWPVYCQQQ